MITTLKKIELLPEFQKFITASKTGRRLMPSGKKVRKGTLEQYTATYKLLQDFEISEKTNLTIQLIHRASLRALIKEKNYWFRFYKKFSAFLYNKKNCYDRYVNSTFKVIKTFFNYLLKEKCFPIGEFHKLFKTPDEKLNPIILTPEQLNFLITNREFEKTLSSRLQKTKDIFVFGSTVALRWSDLMGLKKENIQFLGNNVQIILHTQKTGSIVQIPLPGYTVDIYTKYIKHAGKYILPRITGVNFNIQVKELIKKAGWDHPLPKIRNRKGEQVEVKNDTNNTYRFYEHISAHTMRRTAITTLLMLGVDETSVRRISGHAAGSKEFYKYVGLVQVYLNQQVINAHHKLLHLTTTYS